MNKYTLIAITLDGKTLQCDVKLPVSLKDLLGTRIAFIANRRRWVKFAQALLGGRPALLARPLLEDASLEQEYALSQGAGFEDFTGLGDVAVTPFEEVKP